MRNFTGFRSNNRTIIPKQRSTLSQFCCRFSSTSLKTKTLSLLVALLPLSVLQAQEYVPLTISSGFNEDVVANGAGDAASSTTSPVDGTGSGANYAFMSTDFTDAPATALPVSGLINSQAAATPGLMFQLASYSENNSLRLADVGDEGTLTFAEEVSAYRIFILGTSGNGEGTITGTVNFTDGTTQTITNSNIPDWYNGTPFTASGFGRVSRTDNTIQTPAGNPRLYQVEIVIDAANQTKLIESITVEKVSGGFVNIMGVSADVIPDCPSPTGLTATTGETNATINWATPVTEPTGGYDYYYSTDSTPPTESTTPEGNTSNTSVEITGLTTGETYYFWVRSNCGASNLGYWQLITFTTGQISATYNDGNIPTQYGTPTITSTNYCTPEAIISIEVPAGYQIADVNTTYSMTATGGAWMSEQRSYIYSPTLGIGEAALTSGSGSTAGTHTYNRSLSFANGATGTVEFALRAWRTWGGSDCNTDYNYVVNGSWTITVTYEPIPACPAPLALNANVTGLNEAVLSWMSVGSSF